MADIDRKPLNGRFVPIADLACFPGIAALQNTIALAAAANWFLAIPKTRPE